MQLNFIPTLVGKEILNICFKLGLLDEMRSDELDSFDGCSPEDGLLVDEFGASSTEMVNRGNHGPQYRIGNRSLRSFQSPMFTFRNLYNSLISPPTTSSIVPKNSPRENLG